MMDLVRTIEEDTEVQNYSEDSDAEVDVSSKHNLTFNAEIKHLISFLHSY